MKSLSPNSRLITLTEFVSDLMWINLLTIVFCLPIFTAGAALTAKDYMCYKVLNGEGPVVARDYFSSFKRNFKQATIIWMIELSVFLFFAGDVFLLLNYEGRYTNIICILCGLMFFLYIIGIMIFPVLSRFEAGLLDTVKNGLILSVSIFPKALLMGILYLIPPVLSMCFAGFIPLFILFGLSVPGYLSAKMYKKTFNKLEEPYLDKEEDNSHFDEENVKILGQDDE